MAQALALSGASQALVTSPARYTGFALRETSGSAGAVVRLWDNASAASGTLLEEIALTAGESAREFYSKGIDATQGIFVQVVSGAVAGSLRVGN